MTRLLTITTFVVSTALAIACSESDDAGGVGATPGAGGAADGGITDDGATPEGSIAEAAADAPSSACQAISDAIGPALDTAAKDPAVSDTPVFTLLLETEGGQTYAHSNGDSTASTMYESASTSKLVSAVVILDLVDQGLLTLETKAHDLIPFWTETSVTLRQLLAFTSGFSDDPPCINQGSVPFETCVESIYTTNSGTAPAAGTVFQYASSHLHVAGLMAIKAKGAASWTSIFDAWKAKTNLFPTSKYDLPSTTNPRLAGGMHWTATEYLGFLRALAKGQILTADTRAALFANQRGAAVAGNTIAFKGVNEDWAYGLGNWLECKTATTQGSYNCGAGHRNSSPGAYGAYPFIDFDHHYFGILARQGGLGTGFKGVNIFRAAEPQINTWAACK